jgi:two-component system response regulator HydG
MPEPASKKAFVLVVEDEQDHAQVMCEALQRQGHRCDISYNLAEAVARMEKRTYDVIVTDLMMEGKREGLEVLRKARELHPPPPVILVSAHGDIPIAVQAMNEGAYSFIEKPLDLNHFRAQVSRAAERSSLQQQNEVLRDLLIEQGGFEGIIGKSAVIQKVLSTARQIAASDIPVLIMGESGTGKELIARAIHHNSRRRKNRMVALNCAGLSESILEDELFGHIKGAYTGAQGDRPGRFEHADGGTLFMDEIGDMPSSMQAKLLRVLENGEIVRLGSNEPIKVDVRLISATNRDLDEMVAEKQFREDLFFRIKGATLVLPPLRERREDIPLLLHYFVKEFGEKYHKEIEGVAPEAQQILMSYGWPGNVRQLRTAIENMVVLSPGKTLTPESLPPEIRPSDVSGMDATSTNNLVGISIEQANKDLILNTLKMVNGNREQAAKMLGIGERTLYRKIREYGL